MLSCSAAERRVRTQNLMMQVVIKLSIASSCELFQCDLPRSADHMSETYGICGRGRSIVIKYDGALRAQTKRVQMYETIIELLETFPEMCVCGAYFQLYR